MMHDTQASITNAHKIDATMKSSPSSSSIVDDQKGGGGAINEKIRRNLTTSSNPKDDTPKSSSSRGFSPIVHKAHLWHALEGLDRYPNYLSRWNNNIDSLQQIDELEDALELTLQKVRKQRSAIIDKRRRITQLLNNNDDNNIITIPNRLKAPPTSWEDLFQNILDPSLGDAISKSKQFRNNSTNSRRRRKQTSSSTRPSLDDLLSGDFNDNDDEQQQYLHLDAYLLEDLLEPETLDGGGVYSIAIFRQDFCNDIIRYVRDVSTILEEHDIHLRPIDLDVIGLSWINNILLHLILRPICYHLFKNTPELMGGDLDWRQGYVATYKATSSSSQQQQEQPNSNKLQQQKQQLNRLVTHTDDSEITMNIGLGDNFEGGILNFWGLRGEENNEIVGSYTPIPGRAVIHAGRHFHQVTRVTSGERYALILWARSWSSTRSKTCPCCWLTRRTDKNCICGPRWN